MVKKKDRKETKEDRATPTEAADPGKSFDGLLSGPVKDSAQQVWLAGLGALAKAQLEGGRVFEALVKEGSTLQKQNPSFVGAKFAEAAARMSGLATEASARAAQPWDRLETIFEERVAKAMTRLGTPTSAEVAALTARVDELTARLDALSKAPRARQSAPPVAVKKARTRSAASKKSP